MAECSIVTEHTEGQEQISQPPGPEENNSSKLNTVVKSSEDNETEGRWMGLFRKCISTTIQKCISAASYRLFAQSFKALHVACPKALHSVHSQFVERVTTSMEEDMKQLYAEENICSRMNELEELNFQGDPDHKAWRPTKNVANNLRAHTQPLKVNQVKKLEKMVEALEQENGELRVAVEARRKRFLDTQKALQEYATELEQACRVCPELPLTEMEF